MKNDFKIGVVCASSRFSRKNAPRRIEAWMAREPSRPRRGSVVFHPACFLKHGHFAGDDRARDRRLRREFANDPRIDAIWFARGGYGSCRIAEAVIPRLDAVSPQEALHGLFRRRQPVGRNVQGRVSSIWRTDRWPPIRCATTQTARGALSWLTTGRTDWIEPSLADRSAPGRRLQPDHPERTDRHAAGARSVRSRPDAGGGVRGRLPDRPNDVSLDQPGQLFVAWLGFAWDGSRTSRQTIPISVRLRRKSFDTGACVRAYPFLGSADIGHDAANKVVPFGRP